MDQFNYHKVGTGANVVLILHGWDSTYKNWQKFLSRVDKKKFTYIFLELPGFDSAPQPKEPWDVARYKMFCEHFINKLDTHPEFLIAHSFGGRIAIKWLSEDNPFKKAVFVGAAGIKEELPILKKIIKKLSPHFHCLNKIPFLRKTLYGLLRAGDYLKAEGTMKKTFMYVIEEDLTHLLQKIQIPVKLIWGRKDTYTPLRMAIKMNDMIKNSELCIIEKARHGVHMQTPEELVYETENFLTSNNA